jgi:hypothetical protein
MVNFGKHLVPALFGIVLTVSLAACGGGSGTSSAVAVPNVDGGTEAAATSAITAAGLTVGTVTTQSSSTVASGDVISESPAAGTGVAKGTTVALVVSSGPPPVAVPNVVGSTQAAATTSITGAGLTVGTVTSQSNTTVASGDVISENPAAGTSVSSGSSVALVVSTGAPSTTTPTLGGTVVGLASGATVHVLNGADSLALTANSAFTFPTALSTGASYSVSIGSPQPSGQNCAVKNGTGTAGSANITSVVVYCTYTVTTATLTGNYTFVRDDISQQADQLLNLSFDGAGDYSGTSTLDTAGVISTPSFTGTYTVSSVSSIPRLATDSGTGEGAVQFNGSAVAVLATNPLDGSQPNLFLGVAAAQNASASSVDGTYTTVSLQSTSPASATLGTLTVNNGTGTFQSQTTNSNGTISTPSSSGSPGSYTITSTGAITIGSGSGVSGAVSADGDLMVFAPVTSTGNDSTPAVFVAVKQGTGVTSSTLNGVYLVVSLSTGGSPTANDGKVFSLVFANGQFSGTYDENDAGTPSTGNTASGTYTVTSNGSLSVVLADGETLTGTVSADGNVFALTSIANGHAPSLSLGLRQ